MRQFIPACVVALLFFVMLLELGDLFANLWKYLANNIPVTSILKVMWLYVPKCMSFSMPLAILFASAYTMGTMYAHNELTVIFTSGYPLYLLVVPMLVMGFILSVCMFFFEDKIVIHSLAEKNALNRTLLQQNESLSNTNIVILSKSGTVVYTADYYQDDEKKIFSLLAIIRKKDGSLSGIVQTPSAKWSGSQWVPEEFVYYSFDNIQSVTMSRNTLPVVLDEPPETFRKNTTSVDELSAKDAKKFIDATRKAGKPFNEQLSNYYKRFSFPFTIFVVLFLSISLGGRFKKNILLMSILLSLSVAVLYYVTQMMTMLLSKWEYISPIAGAWFPVLIFICASSVILRYART